LITGSSVTRGGGGGAASTLDGNWGNGGAGGGGRGAKSGSDTAVAGTANTGGGGGGGLGPGSTAPAKAGGSGLVVFSVPEVFPVSFSGGVTQTSAVVGTNRVYTVTATSTTGETVTIG
jgi:hypothetical protein